MALFQKIFSSKRSSRGHGSDRNVRKNDQLQKTVPPKLDKSKIRLVIYADSDRGRTPYFDSNAIIPVEEIDKNVTRSAPKATRAKGFSHSGQETSLPQQKQTPRYKFHRLGSDVKVLEEMMFGTVAMAFKGSTLKVHLLRSPPQLMISKVFIPEKPSRDCVTDTESDSSSLPGSSADFSSGEFSLAIRKPPKEKYAKSIPVDVPTKELLSDYSTDDDSGLASFTSSGSLRTSFPSPSNNSISSYNSLHRRWMRAQTTSLDGHHRQESGLVSENSVNRPKRNKLAVGILFGSHDEKDEDSNNLFQSFFFSHFALIEGHVEKLRSVIEKAYFNHRNFLPATMEALDQFRNDIYDLYMAPRLPEPVWLTMMSTTSYKTKLCEKFMETFLWLVSKFDNKNCKFFVSTLLSAVLTQHLAWVATVTPAGGTPSRTYLDKHTAKWVDTLAKTHPYNPLWAQLGDLFGAIGLPRKISRTVVVGKKADVVKRFLYILSYFIRCSELQENSDPQCLSKIVNDTQFELPLSPTLSEKTLVEGMGLERSTSPSGGIVPLIRQSSSNNAIGGNVVQKHNSEVESQPGYKKYRLVDFSVDECSEHVKKTHSEPVICRCGAHHIPGHTCVRLERSDSGYNAANFENSSEFEADLVTSGDKHRPEFVCKCFSEVNCLCHQSLPADDHRINHVCSDSVLTSASTHLMGAKGCNSCTSSSSVTTPTPISSSSTPMGMSELHNYMPNSFPTCSISSGAGSESPSVDQIAVVTKPTSDKISGSLYNSIPATPETILRSQSFSEGKPRSTLAQRLESIELQPETPIDNTKTSDKKFSIGLGDCLDGVIDDFSDSDKFTLSPVEPSSCVGDGRKDADGHSKPFVSRQTSQESKHSGGRPTTLTKCRSITPTELSRRRHLSSTGSIDYEAFDPMIHCKEIKLPYDLPDSGQWQIKAFDRNFGRSLLAGFSDHYMSDFVLQGTSDTNYKSRLLNDLQTTVKHSVLDEPIDEAVCVIADTDNWTVEVASSKMLGTSPSGCTTWTSSQLVADLIESVVEISRLKMSAEFCLMHLEDRLQEIYFKSLMLSEYVRGATTYSQRELTAMLGFEPSDMPLLLAIAGTHSPSLAMGVQ